MYTGKQVQKPNYKKIIINYFSNFPFQELKVCNYHNIDNLTYSNMRWHKNIQNIAMRLRTIMFRL